MSDDALSVLMGEIITEKAPSLSAAVQTERAPVPVMAVDPAPEDAQRLARWYADLAHTMRILIEHVQEASERTRKHRPFVQVQLNLAQDRAMSFSHLMRKLADDVK